MRRILILIALFFATLSCAKVKKKGHELIRGGKEKIAEKKDAAFDKLWPQFDAGTADTRNNKKRFQEFMHLEPGPDVKNLYCSDDRIGINSSFFFSFQCHDTTVKKIISMLHMYPYRDTSNSVTDWSGSIYQCGMPWWDSTGIQRINPYINNTERLYWYLWQDTKKNTVYFETFDM